MSWVAGQMLTSEERLSYMDSEVPISIIVFNLLKKFKIIKPHLSFFRPLVTIVKVANITRVGIQYPSSLNVSGMSS